jgi:ABC-2 type transport system permease protein
MWQRGFDFLKLIGAYTRVSVHAQLEYPFAFFSQILAMAFNDGAWVLFWLFFFSRFPLVNGWRFSDVVLLWTVPAAGFGIAYATMGNALNIPALIVHGELDLWLSHPRAVLPHLLLGRSLPSAWGDVLFGYIVFFAVVRPDPVRAALFCLMTIASAIVFVSVAIAGGSLSFFIGSTPSLAEEWRSVVIMFGTYPPVLFDGFVKLLLFTIVPAGFASYLPVEAVRSVSLLNGGLALLGALTLLAASTAMFYCGLRRYESGNLMTTNG